jgi:hypothetical protein
MKLNLAVLSRLIKFPLLNVISINIELSNVNEPLVIIIKLFAVFVILITLNVVLVISNLGSFEEEELSKLIKFPPSILISSKYDDVVGVDDDDNDNDVVLVVLVVVLVVVVVVPVNDNEPFLTIIKLLFVLVLMSISMKIISLNLYIKSLLSLSLSRIIKLKLLFTLISENVNVVNVNKPFVIIIKLLSSLLTSLPHVIFLNFVFENEVVFEEEL